MAKKDYKFTNKTHSERGIMSTVLGVIALVSVWAAIYRSFLQQGKVGINMGVVGLMITLFAGVGVILGFASRKSQDRFVFFSYVGIVLNLVALACVSVILYAGTYV